MKYYRRKSVPSPIIDGEVAYIELTRGMVSIIDAEYADEIGKYMWRASKGSGWCYAVRWRGSELVRMHRELIGARDGEMVDHINGNGLDNRLSNLRIADASLNGANSKKQRNNSIG